MVTGARRRRRAGIGETTLGPRASRPHVSEGHLCRRHAGGTPAVPGPESELSTVLLRQIRDSGQRLRAAGKPARKPFNKAASNLSKVDSLRHEIQDRAIDFTILQLNCRNVTCYTRYLKWLLSGT
jgi:hypothetical protein